MNWKTRDIFKRARTTIRDECVFTRDQIAILDELVTVFEQALEHEIRCTSVSINHNYQSQ